MVQANTKFKLMKKIVTSHYEYNQMTALPASAAVAGDRVLGACGGAYGFAVPLWFMPTLVGLAQASMLNPPQPWESDKQREMRRSELNKAPADEGDVLNCF